MNSLKISSILLSLFFVLASCLPTTTPNTSNPSIASKAKQSIIWLPDNQPQNLNIFNSNQNLKISQQKLDEQSDFSIKEFVANPDTGIKKPVLEDSIVSPTGNQAWFFDMTLPTDRESRISISLAGADEGKCQSSFFTQVYTVSPDSFNTDEPTSSFTIGWGPSNISTTKEGTYTLTLKDELGQAYSYLVYVQSGVSAECPTPSPTPTMSPNPDLFADMCSIPDFSVLANKNNCTNIYSIKPTDNTDSCRFGGYTELKSLNDVDMRNRDVTLSFKHEGYTLLNPGDSNVLATVNGESFYLRIHDAGGNWDKEAMSSNPIGFLDKMNENIKNDRESGKIYSSAFDEAKAADTRLNDKSIAEKYPIYKDILGNSGGNLLLAIDTSVVADKIGQNGTAIIRINSKHASVKDGPTTDVSLKLQLTLENGVWSKISCVE